MLNSVSLVGRLTRDPESSYTPAGVAVAKFTIAVDRIYKDANTGEKQTDFIPVICWRKSAEFVTQYVGKGRLVSLTGRIQVRHWDDNQGQRRYMTEVVADEVQALDRPREDARSDPRPQVPAASVDDQDDSDPFAEE